MFLCVFVQQQKVDVIVATSEIVLLLKYRCHKPNLCAFGRGYLRIGKGGRKCQTGKSRMEQARSQEPNKKNVFLFPTLNMFLFGSNQHLRHSKRKKVYSWKWKKENFKDFLTHHFVMTASQNFCAGTSCRGFMIHMRYYCLH